jgi:hypothetical protein
MAGRSTAGIGLSGRGALKLRAATSQVEIPSSNTFKPIDVVVREREDINDAASKFSSLVDVRDQKK